MCSNYRPVTRMDRMLTFFGVELGKGESLAPEVWPLGLAPFIRRAEDGSGNRAVHAGHFGLLPGFAKELAFGKRTYNARTETVATLPSFRDAWRRGQRCVVPAEAIYEPCYETGRAVRHRIYQPGDIPLPIAGIYNRWRDPEGVERYSFAMLTVNGAGHPVFQRMHRPEDEKRMVLILDPRDIDGWLASTSADAPGYFRQWGGPLDDLPEPLERALRAPPTVSGRVVMPPKPPAPRTGDLFDDL